MAMKELQIVVRHSVRTDAERHPFTAELLGTKTRSVGIGATVEDAIHDVFTCAQAAQALEQFSVKEPV